MHSRARLWRRSGVVLVVAGLMGTAIPFALASTWSSAPAQLSQNGSGQSATAPSVAIADNGDMAAVWLNQSISGTTTTEYLDGATDSGAGFGPMVDLGAADPLSVNDYTVPSVAEAGNGDVVAVWIDGGHVVWSEQRNPATSFPAATSGTPLDGDSGTTLDSYVHVTMDADGDAIAVWSQKDTGTGDWSVYSAVLPAGAGDFDSPVALASDLTSLPYAQVALNLDGGPNNGGDDAVISWIGGTDGTSLDYTEAYFGNIVNGSPWPTPVSIYSTIDTSGDTLSQLTAAVDADGGTIFAWVDDGTVWSGQLEIGDTSFTGSSNDSDYAAKPVDGGTNELDPQVAIYPSNTIDEQAAVAFFSYSDALRNNSAVVVAARTSQTFITRGNFWTGDGTSTASEAVAAGNDQQPQLSIAGDGVVTMIWKAPDASDTANAIYALSSDQTGDFSDAAPTVEADGIPFTDQCSTAFETSCVAGSADSSGDVVAAWSKPDASSTPQIDAQCLEADAATSSTLTPAPSTFRASSCVDTNTTPTTSTTGTTTTGPGTGTDTTGTTTTGPGTDTTGTTTTGSGTATDTITSSVVTTTPAPAVTEAAAVATTPTPASSTPSTSTPATTATSTTTPVVAKSSDVSKSSGTILVRLPGSDKFVPVSSSQDIPLGAVIDATHGTVTVTVALPGGKTSTSQFWGGEFTLSQAPDGAVTAALTGSSFSGCPKPSHERSKLRHGLARAARAKAKSKSTVVRSLWSNAHGSYTTKGSYGAAAVLGTKWLTRDQCDGTFFDVTHTSNDPHGEIRVTILHPHRHTVLLKQGHSLLAPAPGYTS